MNLKFEKTDKKLKKGMFVSLHNCFPIEAKGSLGVIVDIKKDALGFNYRVLDFGENKTFWHHSSTLIPLKTRWNFKEERKKL